MLNGDTAIGTIAAFAPQGVTPLLLPAGTASVAAVPSGEIVPMEGVVMVDPLMLRRRRARGSHAAYRSRRTVVMG